MHNKIYDEMVRIGPILHKLVLGLKVALNAIVLVQNSSIAYIRKYIEITVVCFIAYKAWFSFLESVWVSFDVGVSIFLCSYTFHSKFGMSDHVFNRYSSHLLTDLYF